MQQHLLLLLLLLLLFPLVAAVSVGYHCGGPGGPSSGAPLFPPYGAPLGPLLFVRPPACSSRQPLLRPQAASATTTAAAAARRAAATAAAAGEDRLLRNIAIVAHVDHGKTTLVDALLLFASQQQQQQQQQQQHRKPAGERQLDREELEKERGITIRAKVASLSLPIHPNSSSSSSSSSSRMARINIIDTPGHADFGGEVERVLHLADGILLVVDANEGPKPQTRVVLQKALHAGLRAVVAVNKVDRPTAKPEEVASRVFDLFLQLDASEEQADFEVVYTSALKRQSGFDPGALTVSMGPLVSALLRLPPPSRSPAPSPPAAAAAAAATAAATAAASPLQLQVAHVEEDVFKGRLVLGKLQGGALIPGAPVGIVRAAAPQSPPTKAVFNAVYRYEGLELAPVDPELLLLQQQQQQQQGSPGPLDGDLLVVGGLSEEVRVGDSLVDLANPRPLTAIRAEPPTVSVVLLPNSTPMAGRDSGQPTTILTIRDRLKALIRNDISAKVNVAPGGLRLSGRGPLHLAVLIETLRRQGLELAVAAPDVLPKWSGTEWLEPYEDFEVTLPADSLGVVLREVQNRRGSVTEVIASDPDSSSNSSNSSSSSSSTLLFRIATRFSFGLKTALMEATKGAALLHSSTAGFLPLLEGAPVPVAARGPPPPAAAAAAAGGGGGGEEEEEEALLLLQQQQQQQRLPREGERQQGSRSVLCVKRNVERGEAAEKQRGFLVAVEAGNATVKGIQHAQERGEVFVSPGDEVYPGMLVGLHKRPNDLPVNICKAKKLTNMRAATKSVAEALAPPLPLNLDNALDLIGPGEVVEVTPKNVRLALRSALRS